MFRTPTFTLFFMFTVFVAVSQAQYYGALGTTWNNPISASFNRYIWDNMNSNFNNRMGLESSLRKLGCTQAQMDAMPTNNDLMIALSKKTCTPPKTGNSSRPSASPQNSAVAGAQQSPPPITFRPTGKRNTMQMIVAAFTQDKATQQQLIAVLDQTFDGYESLQKQKGNEYDLAAATATFASIAINLQDTSIPVNPQGTDVLTVALRRSLADKLAGVSDNDKQQFYEAVLTFAFVFLLEKQNADAGTLAMLKQSSADACQQIMSLDVTKYRFSDDGIVQIK